MKLTKTIIDSTSELIPIQLFQGHNGPIYDIDGDENYIYSAAADGFVTRWDKVTGKQDSFAIRCEAVPFSIQLFLNGTKLAVGLASGQVHIVDVVQKRETHHFTQHKAGIFAIYETSDNRFLCIGDADGFLSIWETSTMKLLIILPLSCGKIRSIRQLNPTCIIIAGGTGEVLILETEFFNELHRFYAHEAGTSVLCLDQNRKELITGGKDGYLRWWDSQTFTLKKALPAHKGTIYGLEYIDNSHFVSVSRDKSVKVWKAEERTVIQKIMDKSSGHRRSINALCSNKNGYFAYAGDDKLIHLCHFGKQD
jgi:WD40 repeat protein